MTERPGTHAYMLVMEAGVIACDLAQIVLYFDPQATVTLVQGIASAMAHVERTSRLTTAILSIGPDAVSASGLDAAIRAKGGRLHLIGDEAENAPAQDRWSVIMRPFSTDSIIAVLKRDRTVPA